TTKSVEANELIDRERTSIYDDDGRLVTQTTLQDDPLSVPFDLQTESIVSYDYDDANRMLGYHVQVHRGGASPAHLYTSHYTNQFELGEGYRDGGQSVYSQVVASGAQAPQSGQLI